MRILLALIPTQRFTRVRMVCCRFFFLEPYTEVQNSKVNI